MTEQSLVITDTVNKNAFLAFVETTLLPTLAKGSVLVLDNGHTKHPEGTVHHGDDVRDLVDATGCELLDLPTYSPDFVLDKAAPSGPVRNPVEHLFAKVKTFVKALRPDSTERLVQAFGDALKTVTRENILNSFLHCRYGLEP